MSNPRFDRFPLNRGPEDERERPRYRNNYIPGVHEESDFSFGSEYIQDERAYRPSRMSRQSGSRSWINVGDSANSGDYGGREYTSGDYSESPVYYEGDTGGEHELERSNVQEFRRTEPLPFGMTSYPRYFEKKKSFRGHGPQNYKRTDERITEDVCEELTLDHDVDASGIVVETRDGEVTLSGIVPDRESKWHAEDIAERCYGVKNVQNLLRVNNRE